LGLREPSLGSVPLVSGEIGEDLAAYLVSSEQVPSVVAVGVLVGPHHGVLASGGVLLQVMPGAPSSIPAYLEERARLLPAVTQMVTGGASPDVIAALGRGEAERLIRKEGRVEVRCRFCGERYVLDSDDVEAIFASASEEPD
jgi:molecular chaperone Hsp33